MNRQVTRLTIHETPEHEIAYCEEDGVSYVKLRQEDFEAVLRERRWLIRFAYMIGVCMALSVGVNYYIVSHPVEKLVVINR